MWIYLKKERWSPYVAGLFIGLLAVGSLWLFNKTIGVTTTFVKLAAALWYAVHPAHVENSAYYQEYLHNKAWFDWQFMLVIGVFFGAYLSTRLARTAAQPLAQPAKSSRAIQSFVGGLILMFGARLAGGCTSGHVISGGFQLAASGWLFMLGAFALGIPTAFLIYRRRKGASL